LLTVAPTPVFTAYAALPKPPGIDVVTDQQIAGVLMKLGGTATLWSAIGVIFVRWAAAHEREPPVRS
jgi:cytochrome c oxidase assembly factor CtaG